MSIKLPLAKPKPVSTTPAPTPAKPAPKAAPAKLAPTVHTSKPGSAC
jgi:hypothetical protein